MERPQEKPAPSGAPDGLTGKTVGRFVIGERLGTGGMGEVYLAQDTTLKRSVAIKRLAPKLRADERYRRRFLHEAVQASSLNHPNIAGVYDVLEDGDELLLVMELVKGVTLRQYLSAPITLNDFLLIAIQCAEALAAAHEKNLVHGDIKPENIMLTETKQVKVLDFGLAKRAASKDLTGTTEVPDSAGGTFSGTPAYMAPEALLENRPDGRADIFSLGVVFYEILSNGRHPFITHSLAGTIHQVLQAEPISLRKANPHVPPPLSDVVMKALAKDPARRYSTAQQLLDDLEAVERGEPPLFSVQDSEAMPLPRRRVVMGAAAAAVLLALALVGGYLWGRRMRDRARTAGTPSPTTVASLPILINLAVLPIPPTAGDPRLTALGNGLVDSLTDKLALLTENRSFQVAPASEMRREGVTTLEDARQEFGANLGLQINLQRSGETLRATYTLADSKAGRILSTDVIVSPASDPLALESQLALSVSRAMNLDLRPEDERALAAHGTDKPAAYDAFLRARGSMKDFGKAKSIEIAIALFSQALKLDPKFGLAKARLGETYWTAYQQTQDSQWKLRAQAACSGAVESGNADAEGHLCLGLVDNGTGLFQDAVDQFQRALLLDPTRDEAYIGLARAYQQLSKSGAAEEAYRRNVNLRPQYWRACDLLGTFYLAQSNFPLAAEMFQRVTDLAPESYRGYAGLGASYVNAARFNEAIQPLEHSLAIRGTLEAYSNLGTAQFQLKQYDKAAENLGQATKINGRDFQLWGRLGDALVYSGRRPEAMNAYSKAISLANGRLQENPNDFQLLGALAVNYSMVQDRKDAIFRLKQMLKLAGKNDQNALFTAARVYNQLGETDTALDSLKKAMQAGLPKDAVRDSPALDNLRNNPKFAELMGN